MKGFIDANRFVEVKRDKRAEVFAKSEARTRRTPKALRAKFAINVNSVS
jgi:hypothetical protein